MPIKIKEFYNKHDSGIRFLGYLLILPILLVVITNLANVLFNLGVYTGTFIRALYSIVVY
jgi:hypothetical protein